jgi:hypothetical protein
MVGSLMPFIQESVMSEPREVFIEELMAHIMHLTMIPKVQVERAIGPILGLFIAKLLPQEWGEIEKICEEFPLKDDLTCRSTNIDWLLYNRSDDQLVFLELKTACTSFVTGQREIYGRVVTRIGTEGSSFLIDDLKEIRKHSTEPEKYDEVVKCIQKDPDYSECRKAKIVYLAPAAMVRDAQHKPADPEIEWLSFAQLPEITGKFALEWQIIRRNLLELDSVPSPNGTHDSGDRRNFEGTCRLKEVMGLCQENGNMIVIGFDGGARKLCSSSLDELMKRPFKWDYAEGGSGVKEARNWIPGQQFLEIVRGLMAD